MNLLLLNYNNYFNRKLKMFNTLAEYLSFANEDNSQLVANINFIPNDGIDTEQIINSDVIAGREFDYVLCYEDNVIDSRWFVTECVRLRSAQYRLKLHRDVIADNYNKIQNDPIFVLKGNLSNNDSMICNSEGMSFSQKLVGQTLLYQNSDNQIQDLISPRPRMKNAWIVGYVKSGNLATSSISYASQDSITNYETLATLSNKTGISTEFLSNIINYVGTGTNNVGHVATSFKLRFGLRTFGRDTSYKTIAFYGTTSSNEEVIKNDSTKIKTATINGIRYITQISQLPYYVSSLYSWDDTVIYNYKLKYEYINLNNNQVVQLEDKTGTLLSDGLQSLSVNTAMNIVNASVEPGTTISNDYINYDQFEAFKAIENNSIFYDSENEKYYLIGKNIKYVGEVKHEIYVSNPTVQQYIDNTFDLHPQGTMLVKEGSKQDVLIDSYEISLDLVEIENPNTTVPFSSSRRKCDGSVCDIFAIPLGRCGFSQETTVIPGYIPKYSIDDDKYMIGLASAIAKQLGEECYDIQILPYCPIPIRGTRGIHRNEIIYYYNLSLLTEHTDYDIIKDSDDNPVSFIYWLGNCDFNFFLNYQFNYSDRKVESQTNFIRICSPNGQGYFDMNVAKNDGLFGLNAYCTYKPYSPFIQITPLFNEQIYGTNVDKDYRGMICGGDFSLSRLDDKWVNYQLNNKNYQNIFARDMKSLDLHQDYERFRSKLAIPGAVIGGGVSGAMTGAKAGGPWGAVAGAVVGVGVGAATTGLNYSKQEQIRQDTKDYQIDKFQYSLGNVQAMPDTIAKLGTFNINSKYVPYIEEYTCTDKEREALEAKIKYNGMTVQRIGTIAEFRNELEPHFFSGQYIMNAENDIHADSHMLSTIYDELLKGLYL